MSEERLRCSLLASHGFPNWMERNMSSDFTNYIADLELQIASRRPPFRVLHISKKCIPLSGMFQDLYADMQDNETSAKKPHSLTRTNKLHEMYVEHIHPDTGKPDILKQ